MSTPQARVLQEWLGALDRRLEARRQEHLYRQLTPIASAQGPTLRIAGRAYVQFCTNNYLGLASDPEVIAAAQEATGNYGTGSGASRLVAGSMELHQQLEAALAAWKKTEAALVLPTGFMANLAVLTTLCGPDDRIVSDKLNHASLLDAATFSGAEHRVFAHRDAARCADLLAKPLRAGGAASREFVVSDTVFSMDGDVADLPALCRVAREGGALVFLDEAHASGVLGPTGAGLAEEQGVAGEIAVSVGTLSKALGSVGGFVAGAAAVIETLINEARPFIYTTALPPAASAAALAALGIVQREPQRRQRVLALAAHVKRELTAAGFACGDSCTPIIPVLMGTPERALEAAAHLREQGIWVPAIRPPTVKESRLRISLMATHSDAQIEQLLQAMRRLATKRR